MMKKFDFQKECEELLRKQYRQAHSEALRRGLLYKKLLRVDAKKNK